MHIRGYDVVALAKRTAHEAMDDNLLGLAAETAYNFFFGIFPLVLFAAPLLSMLGNRQEIFDALMVRLSREIPPDALALAREALRQVVFTKNAPGLISVGAVLALWAGAGMFSSLMSALNVAYDVHDTRPWWKQKLIAVGCMLLSIVMLGGATTLMVGGEQLIGVIVHLLHLSAVGAVLWSVVQYLSAFVLVVLFIWMLYLVLPDLHPSPLMTLPGAVFAAVFWLVFTYAFRTYVEHFGAYNKVYGTVGAVIVLLTWTYWTMFTVLVGGEFNAVLEGSRIGSGEEGP